MLLELARPLTWDDLQQGRLLRDGLVELRLQGLLDFAAVVVDRVQVEGHFHALRLKPLTSHREWARPPGWARRTATARRSPWRPSGPPHLRRAPSPPARPGPTAPARRAGSSAASRERSAPAARAAAGPAPRGSPRGRPWWLPAARPAGRPG